MRTVASRWLFHAHAKERVPGAGQLDIDRTQSTCGGRCDASYGPLTAVLSSLPYRRTRHGANRRAASVQEDGDGDPARGPYRDQDARFGGGEALLRRDSG